MCLLWGLGCLFRCLHPLLDPEYTHAKMKMMANLSHLWHHFKQNSRCKWLAHGQISCNNTSVAKKSLGPLCEAVWSRLVGYWITDLTFLKHTDERFPCIWLKLDMNKEVKHTGSLPCWSRKFGLCRKRGEFINTLFNYLKISLAAKTKQVKDSQPACAFRTSWHKPLMGSN